MIMSINTPKIKNRQLPISLKISGNATRRIAPTITPGIFPMPPRTTPKRIKTDCSNRNVTGDIAVIFTAKKQPATPRKAGNWVKTNEAKMAAPARETFEADEPMKIQTGMEVEHPRFGKGKIINLEGEGTNRKATVFFRGAGQKQLLLKFARLKVIG